jgi:hypothetical protein
VFAHVGAVTLPQSTAEKLYAGVALTPQEAEMAPRARQVGGARVPRICIAFAALDSVREPLRVFATDGEAEPA